MRLRRLVVPAIAVLVLAGGGWLGGQEEQPQKKKGRFGQRPNLIKYLMKNLDLNDKQQEQAKKVEDEYGTKIQKLDAELRELRREQIKAFAEILTDDQRAKMKELMQKRFKGKKGPKAASGGGA
jgi:hypothetical protein